MSRSNCFLWGVLLAGFGPDAFGGGGQLGSACCLPNGTCSVTTQSSCLLSGGTYFPNQPNCTATTCNGACCLPNFTCTVTSRASCTASSGTFRGAGTVCQSNTCFGACCFPNGQCQTSTEPGVCISANGEFRGPASTCAQPCGGACCMTGGLCRTSSSSACDPPEVFHGLSTSCTNVDCAGACCDQGGSCVVTGEVDCVDNRGGEFLGLDADCAGVVCQGACCLPDKGCIETSSGTCAEMDGTFQGRETICGDDCPTRMPTAFTYQGQLTQAGVPLNDIIDARFSLWLSPDGQDGANQVGSTVQVDSIEVVNGLFQAEIDFGQNAFNGNARWLQIELRDSGSPDPFTLLLPRVSLNPTPYALQTRGIVALDDGKVGIGTKQPEAGLHIKKEAVPPGGTLALEGDTHAYLTFFPDGREVGRKGYFGFATPTTGDITIGNEVTNGRIKFATSSGTVLATGGEENLRIVRGEVGGQGSILIGTGFSAARTDFGTYTITFDPPFLGIPVITTNGGRRDGSYIVLVNFFNVTATGAAINIYAWGTDGGGFNLAGARDQGFNFIAIGPR